MPHNKSVSVLFLPSSPTPRTSMIGCVNDSGIKIRHSRSDPLIHSAGKHHRLVIDSSLTDQCLEDSEFGDIDTSLLYPHWFSSSQSVQSISSIESTISAEDLIHDMITIEGLRTLYHSCFTCGVSWHQDHISLDCVECGGYALERPCPECDGKCDTIWRRNLSLTHESHRASWDGECKSPTSSSPTSTSSSTCSQSVVVHVRNNKDSNMNLLNNNHSNLISSIE